MEFQKDFKEFLKLLNEFKVEFVIVGSYALAYHGSPRYTGDIDIFVSSDIINAEKIINVIEKFGFGELGLKVDDFSNNRNIIQLGVAPVRIDILTSITGLTWNEAFKGAVKGSYDDESVLYLGREEFIKNKKAVGRNKDLADIDSIEGN